MENYRSFLTALCLAAGLCSLAYAAQDGYIVKVQAPKVYLDWGRASGVKQGDTFTIYRDGAVLKHPVTGAVLGHEQDAVGAGYVESVEEKFSVGHLTDNRGKTQAGDRTRAAASALETSAPAASVPAPVVRSAGPQELWRSKPLTDEVFSITLGDLRGNGQKDVIVASRRRIDVLRWNGSALETVATFRDRNLPRWLNVEAADPNHLGHDRLFATAFLEGVNLVKIVVLELDGRELKEKTRMPGIARVITKSDGSAQLVCQNFANSKELRVTPPAEIVADKNGYKAGAAVDGLRVNDDQLLGFTWGDWTGRHGPELAVLQGGEHLRILSQDSAWNATDSYGGTKNDFQYQEDQLASVFPRLWTLPAHGDQKGQQLLVPSNAPSLGVHMNFLKTFKRGELVSLAWNGTEMAPLWRVPVDGYLADFAVGDALQKGSPQLWLATTASGGKTVIIAYNLP